jgi:peptidylprolyl isomerase
MSSVKDGQTVSVHYEGTFDDGTVFDSSRSRGTELTFQLGSGQLIAGFNDAVLGMEVGQTKKIHLEPKDAYGPVIEEAVKTMPRGVFPEEFKLVEGATVQGQNEMGQQLLAKIMSYTDDEVTLDMNHPMAGKDLNFEIELLNVDDTK